MQHRRHSDTQITSLAFGADWNLSLCETPYDQTGDYTITVSRDNGWTCRWYADSVPDFEAIRQLFNDMRHGSYSWNG